MSDKEFLKKFLKFAIKEITSRPVIGITITNFGSTGSTIAIIIYGIIYYRVKRYREKTDNDNETLKFLEGILLNITLGTLGGFMENAVINYIKRLKERNYLGRKENSLLKK
jgi:hypothetical protein